MRALARWRCGALAAVLAQGCGAPAPCHDVAQVAVAISEQQSEGALPVGQGGTLQNGTWTCTRHEWFEPRLLRTRQVTLRLSDGTAEIVENTSDSAGLSGAASQTRITATLTVLGGGAMLLEQTCPRTITLPFDSYTARPDEVTLISSSAPQVITFRRQ